MNYVCHWVADKTVPGGRFFLPGCMGGAHGRHGQEFAYCTCDRRRAKRGLTQRVNEIEKEVANLKKALEART
jgi:hypothetical protein